MYIDKKKKKGLKVLTDRKKKRNTLSDVREKKTSTPQKKVGDIKYTPVTDRVVVHNYSRTTYCLTGFQGTEFCRL